MNGVPDRAAIMSAVERILASAAIGNGSRLPALLRYVVIEELEGRGDRLKAYSIGTDVCGKSAGFDPQSDSSVRVEMGRLRKALSDFYQLEATSDVVVIEIPVGTYRPIFGRSRDSGLAPTFGSLASPGPRKGAIASLGIAVGAALSVCIALLFGIYATSSSDENSVRAPLRIAVNDFDVESKAEASLGPALALILRRELAATSWMSVYRISSSRPEHGSPDYRVTGTISASAGQPQLLINLVEGDTGQAIYSDKVGLTRRIEDSESGVIAPSVWMGLVAAIARADGDMGSALPIGGKHWAAATVGHEGFRCFLRVYDLPLGLSQDELGELRPCLRGFTEDNPDFAPGWAARSLVDVSTFARAPDAAFDILRDASAAIDTARQLDPEDPLVLKARYTMAIMRPERDLTRFRAIASDALKRAPQDPDLAADIANKLAMYDSNPTDAEALSSKALRQNTQPPGWYWWAPTMLAMTQGRKAEAYAYSLRIETRTRGQVECMRAVTAAQLGLAEETSAHIAALREIGVGTLEEMITAIESAHFAAPVEAAMVDGARRAHQIAAHDARAGDGIVRPSRPDKPVVYIRAEDGSGSATGALAGEFRAMVAAFDYVTVSDTDTWRVGENAWPEEYLLRIRDSAFDDSLGLELVHLRSGLIVATDRVPRIPVSEALAEPYARAVVRLFSKRGNMIAHYLSQPDLSPQMACIAQSWEFIRSYRRETYRAAMKCLEDQIAAGSSESLISTHYALMLLEQYMRQPRGEAEPTLDRAISSARRAVELAPASRGAHALLSWLYHLAGQPERQEYHSRAALSGMVVEPDVIALTARTYCVTGRADECIERMRQAARFDTVSPSWHDLQRFLGYYAKGDMPRARTFARLLSQDRAPLAMIARVISAQQLSNFDEANALTEQLQQIDPQFAGAPEELLRRQNFSSELAASLLQDLRVAGVAGRQQADVTTLPKAAVR
ncbi:MAG: hypothetical protein H6883_10545 [Rhodobiaceae bacterium]|nr:hypothetical protein [Rhodobiaceae bacterium]MCC0056567.1 hypothetical protein [Rhodobiaceae bacterium]